MSWVADNPALTGAGNSAGDDPGDDAGNQPHTTGDSDSAPRPLLVVILGPTGSGKTALSLALADRFPVEIVSCDSVAVYRELEIGTAKPRPEERSRVPHHMLDLVAPPQPFTAGDYARLARQALGEIAGRAHLPIVVGGSGLYLRALLEGLFPGPRRSEPLRERLRQRVREKGSTHLHRLLKRMDAASAAAIHPNDQPKLIRAVEVCLAEKKPMSELWRQGREPLRGFNILRLGLNPERGALYQRINTRAKWMFDAGLLEETRELLARYGGEDGAPALKSLGYRQAAQFLRGELTRERAIAAAQQGHRNFAKRQMTWFRREPEVCWIDGFGDDSRVQQGCLQKVAELMPSAPDSRL